MISTTATTTGIGIVAGVAQAEASFLQRIRAPQQAVYMTTASIKTALFWSLLESISIIMPVILINNDIEINDDDDNMITIPSNNNSNIK
jgi:hypothetical protein